MHFKYRKESKEYCPKMSPIFGHSLPSIMGCDCPAQGLSMPTWWATDARVTGTSRPTEGHRGTYFCSYFYRHNKKNRTIFVVTTYHTVG